MGTERKTDSKEKSMNEAMDHLASSLEKRIDAIVARLDEMDAKALDAEQRMRQERSRAEARACRVVD